MNNPLFPPDCHRCSSAMMAGNKVKNSGKVNIYIFLFAFSLITLK